MPTVLSSPPMSSPSSPSTLARTAFIPRSMLMPWSASPIAESRRVRYSLFSAMVSENASTQAKTWVYGTLTPTASTEPLDAPPQSGCIDRSVPEPRELAVQLEERDRTAGHLQRRDVRADQVPVDLDPTPLEQLVELVVDDVELDRRCAAHAVDEREHLVALFERDVVDHRRCQALDDLARGSKLPPLPAGLAVNADSDLHLVVAELERRRACGRHDARRQRHAHAAAVRVHLPAEVGDLLERLLLLRGRAADLLCEHRRSDASPPGRVETVLDGDVVVDHDRLDLDPLTAGELGGHLEVHDVAGVVLHDVHDAGPAVGCFRRLQHLIRRR